MATRNYVAYSLKNQAKGNTEMQLGSCYYITDNLTSGEQSKQQMKKKNIDFRKVFNSPAVEADLVKERTVHVQNNMNYVHAQGRTHDV